LFKVRRRRPPILVKGVEEEIVHYEVLIYRYDRRISQQPSTGGYYGRDDEGETERD
jgi:hypothetical protein